MDLGEWQAELLAQAQRQTRAQESIVNILWGFIALAVVAGTLALILIG